MSTESQRRQYALADAARAIGFASVSVIDEDLGRSGSGLVERPGFQKLVATVCAATTGAVFCIEASRLARNGRDWHHLIDLCAITGTLVIDPDGTYDPRLVNDRLLLGLKGTMSEYELSLLRQRGLAARDSKAKRGELRFALPPGYCWDELGRLEIDADERIADAIRLVFRKFRELGSARQVLLWAKDNAVRLPVARQGPMGPRIEWKAAQYFNVIELLRHPIYAGAYVFGRTGQRVQLIGERAHKTHGHAKPMQAWNVLIREHHPGYISWTEFEENQRMLEENAHMKKRMARKSARGGRALLTGLVRCGRCARMMRVFYGMQSGHAHRYQCPGERALCGTAACIGIGGVRVDRAVAAAIVEAVSPHAIEAAIQAAERMAQADAHLRQVVSRELEEARYEASLAARRYECVDPAKRLVEAMHPAPAEVMRKLGGRWPDRQLAVTMNRMRCKSTDGKSWTAVRVRELRERLGIAEFDPNATRRETLSVEETARRLQICVGSVHRLIREGILPAKQAMPSAPWEIPLAALSTEAVRIGVRNIIARRPANFDVLQDVKTLRLPGL